jgi:DNA-binding transcriptional LysR family regulator
MLEQLRALAVFAKVVDLGSFRAAARFLGLSPSVVSHHVRELEARIAAPLLHRSTRQLSLTPAGERLVVFARQIVEAAERGLHGISSGGGKLRITAPAFLAPTPLGRDLALFSLQHPRVELMISFGENTRDLLRDGFDVALRIGKLTDSTYRSLKLADMQRLLVASPALLERGVRIRSPRDLEQHPFIQLSSRPPVLSLSAPRRKPVTLRMRPNVSVDSAAAIRELVLAGAGIATLPELLVRDDVAHGRLTIPLPRWTVPPVTVYAVWPEHAQRSELTRAFVAFVRPRIASLFATSS